MLADDPVRREPPALPSDRQANWGPENLSDLPKVVHVVRTDPTIWPWRQAGSQEPLQRDVFSHPPPRAMASTLLPLSDDIPGHLCHLPGQSSQVSLLIRFSTVCLPQLQAGLPVAWSEKGTLAALSCPPQQSGPSVGGSRQEEKDKGLLNERGYGLGLCRPLTLDVRHGASPHACAGDTWGTQGTVRSSHCGSLSQSLSPAPLGSHYGWPSQQVPVWVRPCYLPLCPSDPMRATRPWPTTWQQHRPCPGPGALHLPSPATEHICPASSSPVLSRWT